MGGHGPDFGMLLTDGNYSSGSYRFGFQGQEMDDEIKGTGYSINFKYRMHDPRIGRFFAVDPLAYSYPYYTPDQFAGNTPIRFYEIEGEEPGDAMVRALSIGAEARTRNLSYEEVQNERFHYEAHGLILGAVVFTDVFFTKGYISTTMFLSSLGESMWHTDKAYEAKEKGDIEGYNRHMAASGQHNVEIGIEMATLGFAKGLPRLIKSSRYFIRSSKIWGGALDITKGKTTTVLGQNAAKRSGLNVVKSKGLHRQGQNTGGYNMLTQKRPETIDGVKFDFRNAAHRDYYWENINRPWLDEAIERGDVIRLVDKPSDANMYEGGVKAPENLNFFGREVKYLESRGYTIENGVARPPTSID